MSACPECHHPLTSEPPYPEWCPSCDWNVARRPSITGISQKTRFARLQARLVRGLHEDVLRSHHTTPTPETGPFPRTAPRTEPGQAVDSGPSPQPAPLPETGQALDVGHLPEAERALNPGHVTQTDHKRPAAPAGIARAIVFTLAVLTHLLTPAFLLLGIYLLTRGTLFAILPALVALDLAWLLRPRAAPFPPDTRPLTRETAPHLFALLDRIGAEVGAPRTDIVAISGEVNASSRTYGWRRRPVIEIGYPMWLILTPQERIGLLAHELAHSSNGDSRHGFVVGSALHSLAVLHDVTRFDWREGDGVARLIAESLLAILGLPVRGLMAAMELLLYRSSQRAEYRADELGARVAGAPAMTSLLDALNTRAPSAMGFLRTSAHTTKPENLWTALRIAVDALPASELERRRRAARLEELRVDSTHPPTYLRMEWVAALPYEQGRVPATDGPAIDKELESVALQVAQAIRENAQSALYH
ncbi:M48 family metallopeptidase [Nonomuraea rubra]|uniref:M48 family metallopeptidase n=1 Tax=Nonomuraea rubra TaxID=46180 RepID=UPI0033D89B13